jgi:hypothetical protein
MLACQCDPVQINGNNYIQWIGSMLGDCVYSNTEITSVYFGILSLKPGLISLLFCEFAMLPQLWKNYQLKSVVGLSFSLLVCWTIGDFLNLVGTFLTEQLQVKIILI